MSEAADLAPFYAWIQDECLVSRRVCGGVKWLWQSYCDYCHARGMPAERFAFIQAIATEFPVVSGLASGICLHTDKAAFQKAYAVAPLGVVAKRRARVNFVPGAPTSATVCTAKAA